MREMGQEQFHSFWLINKMASYVSLGNWDHWKRTWFAGRPWLFLLYRLGLRFLKHLKGKYQKAVGYMDPEPREEI